MPIIETFVKNAIRDIPDFPRPGQHFKDISPLLLDPQLSRAVTESLYNHVKRMRIDVVAGVESSGFLFGPSLAQRLDLPFVPIRKQGMLPGDTLALAYDTHFGTKTLELQIDHLKKGQRVLLHDDTLATGNTMKAAAELILRREARVAGFSFLIKLNKYKGADQLKGYSPNIFSLARF